MKLVFNSIPDDATSQLFCHRDDPKTIFFLLKSQKENFPVSFETRSRATRATVLVGNSVVVVVVVVVGDRPLFKQLI